MARKFEYKPGKIGWHLDRCEEIVLIDAYEEISRFVPVEQRWRWQQEFETLYYEGGIAVGEHMIDNINKVRARKGYKTISFAETDLSLWGREHDKQIKAARRKQLRDDLHAMSPDERKQTVIRAAADQRELPPPHRTYEEWSAIRSANDGLAKAPQFVVRPSPPSGVGIVKRQQGNATQGNVPEAREAKPQGPTLPAEQRLERAARMLSLASDPLLIDRIIQQLSPDEALDLATQIERSEMRDALIVHCLDNVAGKQRTAA